MAFQGYYPRLPTDYSESPLRQIKQFKKMKRILPQLVSQNAYVKLVFKPNDDYCVLVTTEQGEGLGYLDEAFAARIVDLLDQGRIHFAKLAGTAKNPKVELYYEGT